MAHQRQEIDWIWEEGTVYPIGDERKEEGGEVFFERSWTLLNGFKRLVLSLNSILMAGCLSPTQFISEPVQRSQR